MKNIKNIDDYPQLHTAIGCGHFCNDDESLCEECRMLQEMEDIECFLGSASYMEEHEIINTQLEKLQQRYAFLQQQLHLFDKLFNDNNEQEFLS